MKNFLQYFRRHNLLFTLLMLLVSSILCFGLYNLAPHNHSNVTLLYILALIIISKYTSGYFYGICASFFCIFVVNYCFTFPYFVFNFTLSGYPILFLEMISITVLTSATTSHLTNQANILAERDKQLVEAEKEKIRANLLRAISHDLRTPLTSIIGTASSLIENGNALTEYEKGELAHHIYSDSIWLLNMVENLLTITRINNDTAKVKKSVEVVEEVASEAVIRLRKRIPSADIRVIVPDEALMIPMDAILIEQVIINLLENAVTHSHSKEAIEFKISFTTDNVVFNIIDYGIGIDETRMENIFKGIPSPQQHSIDSKKGMEIGLSICKTIILAHDGTLTAKNHEHGAEFTFTLPKETTAYE